MNTISKDGLRNLRLESIYHSVETSFGAVRAKITSGCQPTNDDLGAVVEFVAIQIVRTPKFRTFWRFSENADPEAQLAGIADLETRLAMENTLDTIRINQFQALCLLAYPQVLELLLQLRVRLYKTFERRVFITSDSPCCVIEYADSAGSMFECLASPTVNVLFPLSPNVVAILDRSGQPHEMWQVVPDDLPVDRVNSMIWHGAARDVVMPHNTGQTEWATSQFSEEVGRYVAL